MPDQIFEGEYWKNRTTGLVKRVTGFQYDVSRGPYLFAEHIDETPAGPRLQSNIHRVDFFLEKYEKLPDGVGEIAFRNRPEISTTNYEGNYRTIREQEVSNQIDSWMDAVRNCYEEATKQKPTRKRKGFANFIASIESKGL